ncbi:hypothetical protein HYX12_04365 [Candidatus Woesearchaeota archaeon]|nr:hypothetical protein [Candidatus Woesearchaeota archaeon]
MDIEDLLFAIPTGYIFLTFCASVVSSMVDQRFTSRQELDHYVQGRLRLIPAESRPRVHSWLSGAAEIKQVGDNEFRLRAYSISSAKHELGHLLGGHLNRGNLEDRGLGAKILYHLYYEPMATFAELMK